MDNVENVENTEQEEQGFGSNHIQDLIKASLDQDYNHANKVFGDIMTIKMTDLLDQEKVKMADQVYNGAEEEQPEEDLENDEEIEDDEDEDEDDNDEDEDEDEDEDAESKS